MSMRKSMLAFLALGGCTWDMVPPEHELRHFTKEELEAGPSDIGMHAAILNDVRRWRELLKHLDEGLSSGPMFKFDGGRSLCSADEMEISRFDLRNDLPDQPYRVEESAYFCPKESVYYYHYTGGPRKLDVWLGPYKIDRPGRKLDDYKH